MTGSKVSCSSLSCTDKLFMCMSEIASKKFGWCGLARTCLQQRTQSDEASREGLLHSAADAGIDVLVNNTGVSKHSVANADIVFGRPYVMCAWCGVVSFYQCSFSILLHVFRMCSVCTAGHLQRRFRHGSSSHRQWCCRRTQRRPPRGALDDRLLINRFAPPLEGLRRALEEEENEVVFFVRTVFRVRALRLPSLAQSGTVRPLSTVPRVPPLLV